MMLSSCCQPWVPWGGTTWHVASICRHSTPYRVGGDGSAKRQCGGLAVRIQQSNGGVGPVGSEEESGGKQGKEQDLEVESEPEDMEKQQEGLELTEEWRE